MLRIFALLLVYFFTFFARPYFMLAQLLIHIFWHKQLYAVGSFQFQQLDFSLNTTRITDQAAAGTHHTVARDDERNGVMSHGSAHRLGGHALPQAGRPASRMLSFARMGFAAAAPTLPAGSLTRWGAAAA